MTRSKSKPKGPRKHKPQHNPSQPVLAETCAQVNSRLFQLPQEVRDKIYAEVFTTWYGRMGNGYTSLGQNRGPKTARDARNKNALALLRTCHRAEAEVGHTWMRYGLFFKEPRTMLDVLAEMPRD